MMIASFPQMTQINADIISITEVCVGLKQAFIHAFAGILQQ